MIGIILRNMRENAGLTQKQLADQLNLAYNTISSYERGNSQPDFDTIYKIIKACGYDIRFLSKHEELLTMEDLSRPLK